MEAVAKLNNVPSSPRKMRLVANLIRGKSVTRALGLLKFEANAGAPKLEKLLLSALSNWQAANADARIEDANLFIKEIKVDEGKMLKRLRPAPQGRGHRIRKRSNHVTLVIDSKPEVEAVESSESNKAK
jgi:large subunit ribosomal protein L22